MMEKVLLSRELPEGSERRAEDSAESNRIPRGPRRTYTIHGMQMDEIIA